ncbi:MAG: hypothetical protein ACFB00_09470 [Parvularculaceae bacterium]
MKTRTLDALARAAKARETAAAARVIEARADLVDAEARIADLERRWAEDRTRPVDGRGALDALAFLAARRDARRAAQVVRADANARLADATAAQSASELWRKALDAAAARRASDKALRRRRRRQAIDDDASSIQNVCITLDF